MARPKTKTTDADAPQPGGESSELALDGFRQPQDDRGLSLEELSGAFAQMMESGSDPYQTQSDTADEATAQVGLFVPDEAAAPQPGDDACEVSPRSIVEAMLFVGRPDNRPLTSVEIASLMRGVRSAEIDELVASLNEQYADECRPYRIAAEGDGYRLELSAEHSDLQLAFQGRVREARLSQAAIDVLAIVAYNQPIDADEVARLRGAGSAAILSQLVRRQLLYIERSEVTESAGERQSNAASNGTSSNRDAPLPGKTAAVSSAEGDETASAPPSGRNAGSGKLKNAKSPDESKAAKPAKGRTRKRKTATAGSIPEESPADSQSTPRPIRLKRNSRYHTTERFLEIFGLKSINDLPKSQDLNLS